jgi:hypothetical protein
VQRRPVPVRVLEVALILEATTFGCLSLLAVLAAGLLLQSRTSANTFGDLAAVVVGGLAVLSLVTALIAITTWLALRTRRELRFLIGCVLHAVPALPLLRYGPWAGYSLSPLLLLVLWFGGVVVLGLLPATRSWVGGSSDYSA